VGMKFVYFNSLPSFIFHCFGLECFLFWYLLHCTENICINPGRSPCKVSMILILNNTGIYQQTAAEFPQYYISWKSIQWFSSCYIHTYRHTGICTTSLQIDQKWVTICFPSFPSFPTNTQH
jgi:hypothetical protein